MMALSSEIYQGEIWLVDFEPQIGSEIKKKRPALVLDSDFFQKTNIRFIVPFTSWREKFGNYNWILKIKPNSKNGLDSISGINCRQIKTFSTQRFIKKIGFVDRAVVNEVKSIFNEMIEI